MGKEVNELLAVTQPVPAGLYHGFPYQVQTSGGKIIGGCGAVMLDQKIHDGDSVVGKSLYLALNVLLHWNKLLITPPKNRS